MMIKKTIYALAAFACMASATAMAQTVEKDSLSTQQPQQQGIRNQDQTVDSLRQVVDALSADMKKVSDEARDQKIWKDRAKYFNISYVKQSLTQKDVNGTWNSKLGVAISRGRTYYLHKKPILGMIKFGIDWTQFDVNFAMYEDKYNFFNGDGGDYEYSGNYYMPDGSSSDYYENYESETSDMYQAEISMQVGPSVTINPIDHLKVSGYFRVAPSFSMLYAGEEFNTSYGTFFTAGGAISYKVISLGIEGRWGNTKYKSLIDLGNVDDFIEDGSLKGDGEKSKWKTGSTRFYISFRF